MSKIAKIEVENCGECPFSDHIRHKKLDEQGYDIEQGYYCFHEKMEQYHLLVADDNPDNVVISEYLPPKECPLEDK